MKDFILLFTVLSSSFAVNAQVTIKDVAGSYERKLSTAGPHIINYTLNLNADGTFQFHAYDKIQRGTPEEPRANERNSYAKGTWVLDKKAVSFSTSSTDFDEKFTLDFNNSKARFIRKHPRDRSEKVVETSLRFYESQMDWMQSLLILKME